MEDAWLQERPARARPFFTWDRINGIYFSASTHPPRLADAEFTALSHTTIIEEAWGKKPAHRRGGQDSGKNHLRPPQKPHTRAPEGFSDHQYGFRKGTIDDQYAIGRTSSPPRQEATRGQVTEPGAPRDTGRAATDAHAELPAEIIKQLPLSESPRLKTRIEGPGSHRRHSRRSARICLGAHPVENVMYDAVLRLNLQRAK
ncbi:unnamed protein product [Trichogramma brassicae]|uniref:Uncharacterized protein n=1 Tax=Trichogramma brassicae TaxID=86971 RepID=A0A6H5J0I2_9HYME|nr:unnamed protein product [Trichogramma brassicae]